jgi:RimJ/RimL family protein N-acetyltransferase
MNLCFRSVLPADSILLLRWRNDPDTRGNSVNTAKVSLEEHTRWFHKLMTFDPQRLSIAELDGLPVGVIRLDWNEEHDRCEISFTVAPEHRRKGIGYKIVQQQVDQVCEATAWARVKVANEGSRRIFERLGFRIIGQSEKMLLYAKDLTAKLAENAVSQLPSAETIRPRASI